MKWFQTKHSKAYPESLASLSWEQDHKLRTQTQQQRLLYHSLPYSTEAMDLSQMHQTPKIRFQV
jgi:hypothetical protein